MVPQICDIKLTGGKKLQVREVSEYVFSPIFPLSFRNDSNRCIKISLFWFQMSDLRRAEGSILSVKIFQSGSSCSKLDEQ